MISPGTAEPKSLAINRALESSPYIKGVLCVELFSLEFAYVKGGGDYMDKSSFSPLFGVSKSPTILYLRAYFPCPLYYIYISPGDPVTRPVSFFQINRLAITIN